MSYLHRKYLPKSNLIVHKLGKTIENLSSGDQDILERLKSNHGIISGSYALYFLTRYVPGYETDMPIAFNDVDMYMSVRPTRPAGPFALFEKSDHHMEEISLQDGTTMQMIYQNPAAKILETTFFHDRKIALCLEPVVQYTKTCIAQDLATYPTTHTPEGILSLYDMGVCQVTIHYNDRAGYVVTLTKACAEALATQTLNATTRHLELVEWIAKQNNKNLILHGCITAKRVFKYIKKTGFSVNSTLMDLNRQIIKKALDWSIISVVDEISMSSKDYYLPREIDQATLEFYGLKDYKPSWSASSRYDDAF